MPSTLDKNDKRGIFALIKGVSGTRKTTHALSFPNPYVLDFDKKMPTVATKMFPGKEIFWDTFPDIFQASDKLLEFESYCPYETLIIDSMTALCNLTLETVADVRGEKITTLLKNIAKNRERMKGKSYKDPDEVKLAEKMSFDYYDNEYKFVRYFIDTLKSLWSRPQNPKHILFIAHIQVTESAPDLKTKVVTVSKRIVTAGRAVASYIPSQFDDEWLFKFDSGNTLDSDLDHVMLTEPSGDDTAKTSLNIPKKVLLTSEKLYDRLIEFGAL